MFGSRNGVATLFQAASPTLGGATRASTGVEPAGAAVYLLREVSPACRRDVRQLTRLHMTLLGHGPMARLGSLFLERFCYTVLIREGLLRAALLEIEGRAAGFVVYTPWSITFHRRAVGKHWLRVGLLVAVSAIRDPRIVLRLFKAARLMFSRRAEITLGVDPIGEVVAIGALPEYLTPKFVRATGLRIGEILISHAAAFFNRAGVSRMRMIVEARNKKALFFYHSLGGRFEPYEQMGEPMVHVSFDVSRQFKGDARPVPECWMTRVERSSGVQQNEWLEYWDGLEDLPELFRVEAVDFVRRLERAVKIKPNARVLDFGCGFGYVADVIAPRVDQVFLWDFSSNMRAQARLVTASHPNVGFLDFSKQAIPEGLKFDLIIVNSVVQYMTAEEFADRLSLWRRLLAAGGRLVLSDLIPPRFSSIAETLDYLRFSALNGFFFSALRKGLAEFRRYPKDKLSLSLRSMDGDDLISQSAAAGLEVEVLPFNLTHRRGRTAAVLRKCNQRGER